MSKKTSVYRNFILISQISISMMVPVFLCLAIGLFIDKRFHTWWSVPLLFLGILAGGRNAYILAISSVRRDEAERKKEEEERLQKVLMRMDKDTTAEKGGKHK